MRCRATSWDGLSWSGRSRSNQAGGCSRVLGILRAPSAVLVCAQNTVMLGFWISLVVQVGLIVHVIKTGRNTLWIWVLVLLPLAGPLAYLVVELLPEWSGSPSAKSAAHSLRAAVDPGRSLRVAASEAKLIDSVAAKARLGDEQLRRGDHAGALDTYRSGLKGLYEFDPTLLYGAARAHFALDDAAAACEALEQLRRHNPEFVSPDADLLHARSLQGAGHLERAEAIFREIAPKYPGAEAKCRYGILLKALGQNSEARLVLEDLVQGSDVAPRHVKRAQAEWISLAKRELATLAEL